MAEAIADRLAEAFAEYLHKQVRDEWGYGRAENLTNDDLIHEKYRGIRPAAGYPACPDHTEKGHALAAARRRGEHRHASSPNRSRCGPARASAASTSRIRESRYFSLGKIDRDQVADYAKRKGMKWQR